MSLLGKVIIRKALLALFIIMYNDNRVGSIVIVHNKVKS